MQLVRRKSESNFYESFSDLIFCALVLFVSLVMVLAANVGVQVESLQDAEVQLAASQSEVDASRQQLQGIVDTHRYTGASSQPSLTLAVDVRTQNPKFYFVPVQFHTRLTTSIINETLEQAIERQRDALLEATKCIGRQRGYTLEEFSQITKAISYYSLGRGVSPGLGFTTIDSEQSVLIDRIFPFSSLNAESRGSRLISLNGIEVRDTTSLSNILRNIPPEQSSIKLRIETKGVESEHEDKLVFDGISNLSFHTQELFHAIASGWRLAEEGLNFVPSEKPILGLIDQEPKSLDQVCFDGNQAVNSLSNLDFGILDIQEPVATLRLGISHEDNRQRVFLEKMPMRLKDAVLMLQSIANGTVAVQFVDEAGKPLSAIPSWVETDLLNPSGFVNRTPDLVGLKKWLDETAERTKQPDEPESDGDDLSPDGT